MRKSLSDKLGSIVADSVQMGSASRKVRCPLDFIQNKASGLGLTLYPVQKIIIKAHYGVPLDSNHKFEVTDWTKRNVRNLTEVDYLKFIADQGRCNIDEVVPDQELRQMVLNLGRRSGKTTLSACVVAYETYRLIQKYNPQKYYGITDDIQLAALATGRTQAKILFNGVSTHFKKCKYFAPYLANDTQQYIRLQTPQDIVDFGRYADDEKAKASINVTFLAASAKGTRGSGNLVLIFDEVAFFQESGGASAEEIYDSARPSQLAFTRKTEDGQALKGAIPEARVILISSPAGRQGLFYNQFTLGMRKQPGSENMLCVEAPSWEVNPTVDASFLASERVRGPNIFDQEYGSKFSDRTSGFFDERRDLTDCIHSGLRKRQVGSPKHAYFAGFDFGYVNDATAIAICHLEGDEIIIDVVDSIQAGEGQYAHLSRLTNDHVVEFLDSYYRRFRIKDGVYDQWSAPVLEGVFEKAGLKAIRSERFSPTEKTEIWKTFKSLVWDKKVKFYNDIVIADGGVQDEENDGMGDEDLEPYLRELLRLQITYKSKTVWEVAAPKTEGSFDDMSDAVSRAVYLANQQKREQRVIAGRSNSSAQAYLETQRQQSAMTRSNQRRIKLRNSRGGGGSHQDRMLPMGRARF